MFAFATFVPLSYTYQNYNELSELRVLKNDHFFFEILSKILDSKGKSPLF
ncbi:hypothetical protein J6TS1_25960 [Siminovitchia terrae]|uniref:Uncharacterized protein n=1 Tax=Siminovitchia terrae TaxID=1914933 RepID=A0ABQ4KXP4_SIMTE|nr:hypothetical protein J22TS1_32920 [Siminovitchia terrae]GIN96726.1 hypothetical protein J6TS1_25960 [Siminovitchia terrae]